MDFDFTRDGNPLHSAGSDLSMWFWGIISGLWFGRTRNGRAPKKSEGKFLRILSIIASIVSIAVGIFAIIVSYYFAKQARLSAERIEKVTNASLYMSIKEYTDRMGMDISKIEDPLFFFDVYMADLKGDKQLIKESLLNYIENDSTKGFPYWLLGKYFSDGDNLIPDNLDSAIYYYSKAIFNMDENDPNKPIAYSNRGALKSELKDYKSSIADFDRAIELKPDYAKAFNRRGNAKKNLEDYDGAIEDYDRAIELYGDKSPEVADVLVNRGNAKSKLEDYDGAIADYDRAIELKPDYAEAFYNRGNAKAILKDYDDAIADFDRAIELKPDYADAFNSRGVAKAKLERYDDAIADFVRAIELKPDFNEAKNNLIIAKKKLEELNNKSGGADSPEED